MNPRHIDADIRAYLENHELTCGGLIVRRGEEIILEQNWGYADPATQTPADSRSLYRMMSMTKPVVAVAVMQQIEDGRLTLDTPVSRFIPSYRAPRVAADPRYLDADWTDEKTIARLSAEFDPAEVKIAPAVRDITVRDLLTHSSGLAQGVVGMLCGQHDQTDRRTVADAAEGYARYLLDLQPGTACGYSPMAAFDVLLRVAEIAADEEATSLLHRRIFA
ncbi:MAG: beta-lactamase family protein, partial [Clostridia bacterium]|nr:beta-lactamase family protein [Clostridia bacterium]